MQPYQSILYMVLWIMTISHWAQSLQVRVVPIATKFSRSKNVEVILQYNNTDSKTLLIYKWFLPQHTLDDPIFRVTRDGKPVEYIGKLIKRQAPTAQDVIALEPGKIIKSLVEVSSVYNMNETGVYNIEFDMSIDRILFEMPVTARNGNASTAATNESVLKSTPATLFVEGRQSPPVDQSARASGSYCSPSQLASLTSAMSGARTYANNAVNYMKTTRSPGTSRYATWFGAYSSSNWNTVTNHFINIQRALATKSYVFDCYTCRQPGVFAYVYPTMAYKIYLCGSFWSARTTGSDSKAGVIIHESSHFSVLGGTQDYTYGHGPSRNLAKTNSRAAVMNADNHEYFAENSPYLS